MDNGSVPPAIQAGGTPVIAVRDLEKVYRLGKVDVPALRGVSLVIRKGEWVAVVGPSGSGKSTLMNIVGCLDRPTSGSYQLAGTEVASLSDDQLAEIRRNTIGFVFQTFNLLPRLTAAENVEMPLLYTGAKGRRQRALEVLERVGLAKRANHHPTELSGGEQQRVAIARALINKPSLILADEPTGNLDSVVGKGIIDLFRQLHQEGITLIMVTHDRDVSATAPRVVGFKDGQIVRDELQPGAVP